MTIPDKIRTHCSALLTELSTKRARIEAQRALPEIIFRPIFWRVSTPLSPRSCRDDHPL
jgi:hypothetical protein